MKKIIGVLILLAITACDSNPLGDTEISSCNHSPNFKTGLPVTCQVNLQAVENLKIWLDANDPGTISSINQTNVDSWSDKSGNGTEFTFLSDKALILNKEVNNRTAMRWTSNTTEYMSDALTNFDQDQDFSIALAFKSSPASSDKIKFSNGSGFEVFISKEGVLSFSLDAAEPLTSSISIPDGVVTKLIFIYKSSERKISIYGDYDLIDSQLVSGISAAWGSLNITGAVGLELYEVLIYNSYKTDLEASEIQTYLNNKWGF